MMTEVSCSIQINMADEGRAASPDLFGIFLEDLNHALEGGLYAELVKNRTFNMPELLAGWSLVAAPGSEGTMGPAFVPEAGNPNRWKLRLQIVDVAGGRVGIANEGYWGIPVRAGEDYRLNLTPLGHRASIAIQNVPCLKGSAQVIELSAESPEVENTLNHPGRIVPKDCSFREVGSNFAYLFPPGSITIMKMCSQCGNESI